MSDNPSWYYIGTHGQIGPLTRDQIVELIRLHVVESSTPVWNFGWPDWRPAKAVQEFAPVFQSMASIDPPPTPVPPAQPAYAAQPHFSPSFRSAQALKAGTYDYAPSVQSGMMPNKSRLLAGLLQLVLPGVGRIYLGYTALGILQLVAFFMTCGLLYVWTFLDGIYILVGGVQRDSAGHELQL